MGKKDFFACALRLLYLKPKMVVCLHVGRKYSHVFNIEGLVGNWRCNFFYLLASLSVVLLYFIRGSAAHILPFKFLSLISPKQDYEVDRGLWIAIWQLWMQMTHCRRTPTRQWPIRAKKWSWSEAAISGNPFSICASSAPREVATLSEFST